MKFSIASVLVALTFTTLASANQQEQQELEKRQFPTDSAAIASLLANPSSALAQVTPLLANPTISSAFRSLVTGSSFEAQVSSAYVAELGSSKADQALQSYNGIIASLLGESSVSGGSSKSSSAAGSGSSSSSSGSSSSSSSSSGTNGASLITVGAMGSAIVLGAGIVMAAL